jgi:4-aminobutyrate aminotransferase/(S)-3-amino-2-methylpropionate transaminase
VLDVFAEEISSPGPTSADAIRARMLAWQERWPQIGDVRGLGAMLAIELVRDPATRIPRPSLARP